MCGTIFGIASCKCEEAPNSKIDKVAENLIEENNEVLIKIHPREINSMFDYAAQNKISVSRVKLSLELLVSKSI